MNSSYRNRFLSDGAAAMSNERILLALYDRLLADLDAATGAIAVRDVPTAHDKLVHGQRILEELLLALDQEAWDGAGNLAGIYEYARQLLVQANLRKDPALVAECRSLVEPLAEAWKAAYAQINGAAAARTPSLVPAGANSWGA